MIGAALALTNEEVQASLSGSVSFFAVPAEEYIDADKRARLRKEEIGFPASGKSELIRLGEFDHSDIILTTHVHMMPVEEDFTWEMRHATDFRRTSDSKRKSRTCSH